MKTVGFPTDPADTRGIIREYYKAFYTNNSLHETK